MIAVAAGVRVLVATKPVDFRRGADSLVALVREQLAARSVLMCRARLCGGSFPAVRNFGGNAGLAAT